MHRVGEQFASFCDIVSAVAVGEQAVVADTVKTVRQNVQQETADELVRIERHEAVARVAFASIILPLEGDTPAVEGDETGVANGDAVGVAGEISEDGLGSAERTLSVDHPFDTAERLEERLEGIGIMKRGMVAEELKRSLGVRGGEPLAHEPPEQS